MKYEILLILFVSYISLSIVSYTSLCIVSYTSLPIVSYTSLPIVSYTSLSIISLRYPKYIETRSPADSHYQSYQVHLLHYTVHRAVLQPPPTEINILETDALIGPLDFVRLHIFLNKVKQLTDQLKAKVIEMPSQVVVAWVLNNLTSPYEGFVAIVTQSYRTNSSTINLENLSFNLMDESRRQVSRDQEIALVMGRRPRPNQTNRNR